MIILYLQTIKNGDEFLQSCENKILKTLANSEKLYFFAAAFVISINYFKICHEFVS